MLEVNGQKSKVSRVAIIYLAYNSRPYIDEVVLSLENLNYPKDMIELVIVNNPGDDDTSEYVTEKVLPKSGGDFPKIKFIDNDENVGFAIGNNQGIQYALENNFDYVFLLNNDAKLHPDAISEAVHVAESDDSIGAVQSLIMLWNDPEVVNTSGNSAHFLGFGFTRDYKKKLSEIDVVDGEEIAYPSGAGVLYRAEALRKAGDFDEFLWLYHEDLEIAWRMRLAGWKSVLAKNSIVYHNYEFSRSTTKMFWMERNRHIVHLTHLKFSTLLLLAPAMVVMELAVFLGAIKGKWIAEKLSSYLALIEPKTIRNILVKRELSQDKRTISDKEAMRLFVGSIEHQEADNIVVRYLLNPVFSLYWNTVRQLLK